MARNGTSEYGEAHLKVTAWTPKTEGGAQYTDGSRDQRCPFVRTGGRMKRHGRAN